MTPPRPFTRGADRPARRDKPPTPPSSSPCRLCGVQSEPDQPSEWATCGVCAAVLAAHRGDEAAAKVVLAGQLLGRGDLDPTNPADRRGCAGLPTAHTEPTLTRIGPGHATDPLGNVVHSAANAGPLHIPEDQAHRPDGDG